MKKAKTLKLRREVICELDSTAVQTAAGGVSRPAVCTVFSAATCECTQICG
jgi:hypothetical protein